MPVPTFGPLNQGKHAGCYLMSEANGDRSRDAIVIASGQGVLPPGSVLGKVTASGKYAKYNNAAADGTQAAVAVLFYGVDATSADVAVVAHTRDCVVNGLELDWNTQDAAAQTAGKADLLAAGIIVR